MLFLPSYISNRLLLLLAVVASVALTQFICLITGWPTVPGFSAAILSRPVDTGALTCLFLSTSVSSLVTFLICKKIRPDAAVLGLGVSFMTLALIGGSKLSIFPPVDLTTHQFYLAESLLALALLLFVSAAKSELKARNYLHTEQHHDGVALPDLSYAQGSIVLLLSLVTYTLIAGSLIPIASVTQAAFGSLFAGLISTLFLHQIMPRSGGTVFWMVPLASAGLMHLLMLLNFSWFLEPIPQRLSSTSPLAHGGGVIGALLGYWWSRQLYSLRIAPE